MMDAIVNPVASDQRLELEIDDMPAYWLARSVIHDPAAYKRYTDQVPGIISQFGGKVLGRGGRFQIMEGPQKWQRFVVLEFPTLKMASAV